MHLSRVSEYDRTCVLLFITFEVGVEPWQLYLLDSYNMSQKSNRNTLYRVINIFSHSCIEIVQI